MDIRLRGTSVAALTVAVALIASSCSGTSARSDRFVPTRAAAAAPASRASATTPAPTTATTVPTTTTSTTEPPTTAPAVPLTAPARLTPLVAPPVPGEGAWQPAPGSARPGGYAVYTTQLRPAAGYPASGVAWIDTAGARLALYAGSGEPYGTWPQQSYVSAAAQPSLLAAFNSGFKIYAYRTGWYDQGRTAMPLQPGAASLVVFDNGTATVGDWGRDVNLSPAVVAVRQNLHLLVDHGAPASDAGVVGDWGATLHGVSQTWRSGLGVTASGDLVYVGGPELNPYLLARLLIAAGSVRAMELDINPEWVSFATYTHTGTAITSATDLLAGMYFSPYHYLQPSNRDFLAVLSR